jgi:hypothetical protein
MIRNLDRLSSGHDENIRAYKNTPSYDHIKITSDSISSILEFASAIEQFQNMHKLAVQATTTGNASRNIPNIGKNVPNTVCALDDIRNIFQHIPDTE